MSKWTRDDQERWIINAYCQDNDVRPLDGVIEWEDIMIHGEREAECMREQLVAEAWGLA